MRRQGSGNICVMGKIEGTRATGKRNEISGQCLQTHGNTNVAN